ncbi:MAG: hypothetical protein NW224_16480 [Leptolyngbyaceae cyanobacterium bins.302]|nr:hypothetical protein [Leptolyngbyaceae cyanobacterium bins.302]
MTDPMIQKLELLSADYPIPDPTWDYADIWKQVVILQRCANALTELLAQTEEASPESDRLVRLYLSTMRDTVNHVLADNPSPYLLDHSQGGVYRVNRDR